MTVTKFLTLGDAVSDEQFPAVDVALRRGRHIDREDRVVADVVGARVDRLAVLAPHDLPGRAIPAVRDRAQLLGGDVVDRDRLTVRFEAGPLHREVRERLAGARAGLDDDAGAVAGERVDEEGELCVSGASLMLGYLGRAPEDLREYLTDIFSLS